MHIANLGISPIPARAWSRAPRTQCTSFSAGSLTAGNYLRVTIHHGCYVKNPYIRFSDGHVCEEAYANGENVRPGLVTVKMLEGHVDDCFDKFAELTGIELREDV